MKRNSALIAGATGLVGSYCLQHLIDTYEEIIVLSRRPLKDMPANVRVEVIDFDRLSGYKDLFRVDHVYCCLGTTLKKAGSRSAFRKVDFEYPFQMAQLSADNDVHQFLFISSLGANANSRVFYNQVKGETEDAISRVNIKSIHIFRPSLLLGERQEFRLGESIGEILMKAISPVLFGNMRSYRPIHAETVARAMVNAPAGEIPGIHIYSSDQICQLAEKE
ncbi:MAG: oxidoreductase [Calditrichia bacterium]